MKDLNEAAIEQIAKSLGKCELDLLLNRVDGWGAWITATYPSMVSKGLANKNTERGLHITFDTPLALAIKSYIERNPEEFPDAN